MRKKNAIKNVADSSMSLGDHLEELRARLMLALIGLFIAMFASLFFGRKIIAFIEKPYLDVIERQTALENISPAKNPKENTVVEDANQHSTNPEDSKPATIDPKTRLQSLAPADGFISYIKICTIAGVIVSSPWIFYQLWMFISAGLYTSEKKYVKVAAPFSALLFVAGALFFIFVIAPLTMSFLINFNKSMLGVNSNFTFRYYISFITKLMLVFGVGFQTPILVFFLNKLGLVSIQALKNSRKFVILAIVILAAMATPPDVISQVTLAIPLYVLFELGIIISYLSSKKNRN